MIAALFVAKNGVYFGLEGVDPWDEDRDARLYPGPHPVVAHPPCSTWCQLAKVNEKRYGHKVGDDGGCFASALKSVQTWGGVLEHPAYSHAWKAFGLLAPHRSGFWLRDHNTKAEAGQSWVCQVSQSTYGHRARKRTWLYFVGDHRPPEMNWTELPPTAWVGDDGDTIKTRPHLSKKEAKASPLEFRDSLLYLAKAAKHDY